MSMNRRSFIRNSSLLVGGAAVLGMLPHSVRKAIAKPARPIASIREIKHVVLLMQENRSFDHYFGMLGGVRGFSDADATTMPDGRSVFYQPDPLNPDGYLLPYHLDTLTTNAQCIPSTNHSWAIQHRSFNHGKMNKWISARLTIDGWRALYSMGYFTEADVPFHYALAKLFTICDAYHCSVMGPTYPNRMYWSTGTINPHGKWGGSIISNNTPRGGFSWTTYAERLEGAGVSWRVYQQEDGLGVLHDFATFQKASKKSPLYQKGLKLCKRGEFEHDAINGRLPTVSWILPPWDKCEHPHNMPADGAAFIASKIDAIASNPELWSSTVFILSYDENDGLFDHVPPPVPLPGTQDEFVLGAPIGAGFRVPCIVISPWTVGGRVCSDLFDHTSQLQFLEKVTGVTEPNISQWRRNTFGDLTSTLMLSKPGVAAPVLPDTTGMVTLAAYASQHLPPPAFPIAKQVMPKPPLENNQYLLRDEASVQSLAGNKDR